MEETVIVFRDQQKREILTYVNLDGHGARMDVKQFITMLADQYGSPATTLTKAAFLSKLNLASDQVIRQMKSATKEVAAISVEPEYNESQG